MLLNLLVVCVAASIGAVLRWGLAAWLNPGAVLPWGTLAVNLIGGYLIGVAVAVFNGLPDLDPAWRLMVMTGFLGAFTTFSAFSAEVVGMLTEGRPALAIGTSLLHLGGSLCLTWLGFRTVQHFVS